MCHKEKRTILLLLNHLHSLPGVLENHKNSISVHVKGRTSPASIPIEIRKMPVYLSWRNNQLRDYQALSRELPNWLFEQLDHARKIWTARRDVPYKGN